MEKPEFLIYFLTLMRLATSGQKFRLHDIFIMTSWSLRADSGLGSAVGGFVPKVQALQGPRPRCSSVSQAKQLSPSKHPRVLRFGARQHLSPEHPRHQQMTGAGDGRAGGRAGTSTRPSWHLGRQCPSGQDLLSRPCAGQSKHRCFRIFE